jgi:hypothetical protein
MNILQLINGDTTTAFEISTEALDVLSNETPSISFDGFRYQYSDATETSVDYEITASFTVNVATERAATIVDDANPGYVV